MKYIKILLISLALMGCIEQNPVLSPQLPNMMIPRQVFKNAYRTCIPEELYGANSVPKNLKSIAKVTATFAIPPHETASKILLEFNSNGTRVQLDYIPETYTITTEQSSFITRLTRITYMLDDNTVVSRKTNVLPIYLKKYSPMPNTANIVKEVFKSNRRTIIRIGIPSTSGMWVELRTANALITSIYSKRYDSFHGTPYYTGFDYDPTRTLLKGKRTSLSPEYYSNKLFAEIVMFKLNMKASEYGITPSDYNSIEHQVLALQADSMMTNWKKYTYTEFQQLYHTIYVKNNEYQGPMDTISIQPLRIR